MSAGSAGRPVVLSRGELARRLIAWTGLAGPVAGDVAEVVRTLGAVQIDPMQVVAPAHLWTLSLRRGPTPGEELDRALAAGLLVEAYGHARVLVHRDDVSALVLGWRRRRHLRYGARYGVEAAMRAVMAVAEQGRAFSTRDLDTGERVAGFWDAEHERRTKATTVAVDLLWAEGRLAVVGRRGGRKLYRAMEQHCPEADRLLSRLPDDEATWAALRHAWRTYGVVTPDLAPAFGHVAGPRREWLRRGVETGALVEVRLSDQPGDPIYVVPDVLAASPPRPRRALVLAPLDNLLWHRPRLERLFGFRYRWEAYTPAAERRGGAYNMPVLVGDRFCGELDARFSDGRLETVWRPVGDSGGAVPPAVARALTAADRLAQALRGAPPAYEADTRG